MTKSLDNIEEKMKDLDINSLRYHILENAKSFKVSWVELGRALYTVWKDKLYKDWGYSSLDAYAAKEIGIRKQTAMKLLKSYYFLEKEEPQYLDQEYIQNAQASRVPSYESVDLLRKAKSKKVLDAQDYAGIKKEVFENGKDAQEIRKDLTTLIRQRQELEPEEAYEKKRLATVRRFLGTLKALKKELEISKLLPGPLIKEISVLVNKLEDELG
ncbi:MAG: hypothetical protein WC417_03065 [Candidatus Omnitrophota bacterium]|jgi:hypothetical protein